MGFETKGFDELVKALNNLEKKVQKEISNEALEVGSTIMLNEMKHQAPKAEDNSKYSYTFLKKDIILKGKSNQAKMGIDSTNWNLTRGLIDSPYI